MGNDPRRNRADRRRPSAAAGTWLGLGFLLCLVPACGQAPAGDRVAGDLSPAFARNPLRRVVVLEFLSRAPSQNDPDSIAPGMVAAIFGSALQERRGVDLVPASIDGRDERIREFYDEWSADREFADPALVREIAAADSADAVLIGAVLRWEQEAADDGFETRVELMASLLDGRSGEWMWYGRDAQSRSADVPPEFSHLVRSIVTALVATVPAAGQ